MIAHRAYDLVSLLQDARRDVSPSTETEMIARYVNKSGQNAEAFQAEYALLGLQRNLRILGVFSRLSLRYGKPDYVDLIPRVWAHIQTNLKHPITQSLYSVVSDSLPEPKPHILQRLKDQCATIPVQS